MTLSDKIYRGMNIMGDELEGKLKEKDVKEFIKKEEDLIVKLFRSEILWSEFWEKRDKLVGKDLK